MIEVVIIVMLASIFKKKWLAFTSCKKIEFSFVPQPHFSSDFFYANHCFQMNTSDDLAYVFIEDNERNRS